MGGHTLGLLLPCTPGAGVCPTLALCMLVANTTLVCGWVGQGMGRTGQGWEVAQHKDLQETGECRKGPWATLGLDGISENLGLSPTSSTRAAKI